MLTQIRFYNLATDYILVTNNVECYILPHDVNNDNITIVITDETLKQHVSTQILNQDQSPDECNFRMIVTHDNVYDVDYDYQDCIISEWQTNIDNSIKIKILIHKLDLTRLEIC